MKRIYLFSAIFLINTSIAYSSNVDAGVFGRHAKLESAEDITARLYKTGVTMPDLTIVSDTGTIISDSIAAYFSELATFGDRVLTLTGSDRACDVLQSNQRRISYIHTHSGDSETLTAKSVEFITSTIFFVGTGVFSFGVIPLAYVAVNVISDNIC